MSIDCNNSDGTPFPSVTMDVWWDLGSLSHPSQISAWGISPTRRVSLCMQVEWVDKSSNVLDSHIRDVWVVLHGERRNSPRKWAPGSCSGHLLGHSLFIWGFCSVFTVMSPFFLLLGSPSIQTLVWGLLLGKTNPRHLQGMNLLGVHFLHLFSPLSPATPLPLVYLIPAVYTHSGRCYEASSQVDSIETGIIVGTGFDLCEVSCTQRMQSKRKKELFK